MKSTGTLPFTSEPIQTDALVIGAGPVGLFQVFELGLQGITAHVVDALPYLGGQCIELYADKPIYDIPALPVCTGRELIARLEQQIRPFKPAFHLDQEVCELRRRDGGGFDVETSRGLRFQTQTVFLAAGVGAFTPRVLKVDGFEQFVGKQVFYREPDGKDVAGKDILVLGEGDDALRLALTLARTNGDGKAKSVTLMHRRDQFKASAGLIEQMREACDDGRMRFQVGQIIGCSAVEGQLKSVSIIDDLAHKSELPVSWVVALLGLSPRLGPIAGWGLDLDRKQVKVSTADFCTSEPGLYAVGDINTYDGKKKLIVCGFHEATLAAFAAAAYIRPDEIVHLQYTTASPKLHQLLGVSPLGN